MTGIGRRRLWRRGIGCILFDAIRLRRQLMTCDQELRQSGRLLPGIDVGPCQSGEHTNQHAVLGLADRCKREVVEFGSGNRNWQSARHIRHRF
jgi:hypothetical protein